MKIHEGQLWYRGVKPFFAHGNGNTDMNYLIESLGYSMTDDEKRQISQSNRKAKIRKTKWYINDVIVSSSYFVFSVFMNTISFLLGSSSFD